jgi:outer membrane lipase/esterase
MLRKLVRLLSHTTLLASTLIFGCGLSNTAQAISFNQISQVYFFGDSLTDSGYNNLWSVPAPLPFGKAPTFTTFGGYIWSQYVARDVKGIVLPIYPGPSPADTITYNAEYPVAGFVSGTLRGINFAAAGSTTNSTGFNETWAPSLTLQVGTYLANVGQAADPNAVYFIWSGANDILSLLSTTNPPTQLQLLLAANTAANNIAAQAAALSMHGAKRIVVMALPNLGATPLITAQNVPGLSGQMQNVTFSFNSMLNTALGKVIAQYGTKILYVDIYDLFTNVINATQAGQPYVIAGQSFTFVNATTPACGSTLPAIYCTSSAPTNYVFADPLHPTDMSHRVISLLVETLIQAWQ